MLYVLCGTASAQNGLVIKDADLFSQVGMKTVYGTTGTDDNAGGELVRTVTDCKRIGNMSIITIEAHFNGNLIEKAVQLVRPDRCDFFQSERSLYPKHAFPLPLEVGKSLTYTAKDGARMFKVDSEETVQTEAGTFKCLACLVSEDERIQFKFWLAPEVGIVKAQSLGPQPFTILLKEVKKPTPATPPAGSDVLVNFDLGCDPASIVRPKATWGPGDNNSKRHSTVSVDPREAALDTTGSLCWSYHVKPGGWTGPRIMLTGSWAQFVDLTPYDSVSFYIKGFRPGKCAFSVQGMAASGKGQEYVLLPVEYTTEWKRVTIDLTSEKLSTVDLRRVILFGGGTGGSETNDVDNVVWIDEISAHRK